MADTATTDAVLDAEAWSPTPLTDNLSALFATGAGAQNQGLKLTGEMNRIVNSVSTGAIILPSVGSMEASGRLVVVNSSPNSVNVGAATGEKLNTVSTTSSFGAGILAVAAGGVGVFYRKGSSSGRRGTATASSVDWFGIAGT